jgi:CRISPR-associated endonuclease/helicase Cas3
MLLGKYHTSGITLLQHTLDVVEAGEALFGTSTTPTRLGKCWLRFFKLPPECWERFYWNLLAADWFHDWGKANDGMQRVLTGKGDQSIRHEHFSALLMGYPVVWKWLEGNSHLDREVILSAVLTHHLKASGDDTRLYAFGSLGNGRERFQSLHDDPEFHKLVGETASRLRLPALDLSKVPVDWPLGRVESERTQTRGHLTKLRRDLSSNEPRRRLLHAVRAALIAADAAGSGLRRTGQTICDWVAGTIDEAKTWTDADVFKYVISPRLELIKSTLGFFQWNDFQDHCADPSRVPSRALLLAPCGSGKTLAAWRWIEQQAKKRVGHVLFLYPTRATATEGFRDYVSWAPEADASLMHGTSGFDLEGMFENAPEGDTRKSKDYQPSEAEERLFALGYWGRRAFSATVDQFLAFLQYGYRPVCMLPVLADSVVVIDEVHSFDNNMFSALKGFLQQFDVPVLCMTATLPTNRRDELVNECGLTAYEDRPGDLKTIAEAKRYRVHRVESQAEAETAVREALAAGKRVLWVVNQVKRAHAVVAKFAGGLPADLHDAKLRTANGVPVICYHSRFKLTDRVAQHKATMRALKDEPGPALGVTTQVCEMSLDIDVDLLVTEDCPVTALVQRMGRCNRAQSPRPLGTAGDVLVYKPADDAPYLKKGGSDPLAGLEEFLKLVDGRDLSQDDLEKKMKQVDPPPSPGDPLNMFLASGPYALAGEESFRDSEEFNRQCLLPGDAREYGRAERDEQPGFVLPVPRKLADPRDPDNPDHAMVPRHLGVARDGHYHAAVGYCDRPLTEWGAY